MPKKPGRGPKKTRGGGPGSSQGGGPRGGGGRGRPARGAKRSKPGADGARPPRPGRKSDYFMQPGRRGIVVVLRRPIGNRADAKICGTMPSRIHAKMLIQQLERAESVVKDLFMEATDDGIEALEAVLAACRDEVMKRGPQVRQQPAGSDDAPSAEPAAEDDVDGDTADLSDDEE